MGLILADSVADGVSMFESVYLEVVLAPLPTPGDFELSLSTNLSLFFKGIFVILFKNYI